jgi:hypothetical protein
MSSNKRILEIEYCQDCPHFPRGKYEIECAKGCFPWLKTINGEPLWPIPETCPLEKKMTNNQMNNNRKWLKTDPSLIEYGYVNAVAYFDPNRISSVEFSLPDKGDTSDQEYWIHLNRQPFCITTDIGKFHDCKKLLEDCLGLGNQIN